MIWKYTGLGPDCIDDAFHKNRNRAKFYEKENIFYFILIDLFIDYWH
jgi:hypothetical protein